MGNLFCIYSQTVLVCFERTQGIDTKFKCRQIVDVYFSGVNWIVEAESVPVSQTKHDEASVSTSPRSVALERLNGWLCGGGGNALPTVRKTLDYFLME